MHEMMGLEVEVAEHGVGFPPAEEFNFVSNNVFVKKGRGTGSAECFGSDVGYGEGRRGGGEAGLAE